MSSRKSSRFIGAVALAVSVLLIASCGKSGSDDIKGTVVKDGLGCGPAEVESGKAPTVPKPENASEKVASKDVTVGKGCPGDKLPYRNIDMVGVTGSGHEFINTWKAKRPLSVSAGALLDSIELSIADMKVGGVRTLSIPAELGYGAEGDPSTGIGPDEPLFITLQLTGVSRTRTYCAPAVALPKGTTKDKPAEVPIPVKFPNSVKVDEVEAGKGHPAEVGDQVVVDYVGVSCASGKQFDSSYDSGKPFEIDALGFGSISGFAQGLEGAQTGAVRIIQIPAKDGYGDQPQSDDIAVGDNLVFYVKVRKVTAAADVTTTTVASTTTAAGATTTAPTPTTAAP